MQVSLVPVADRHEDYAAELAASLKADGRRVEVLSAHTDTLGARIRNAKLHKVPYVLVVGDDDVAHRTVGVNQRGSEAPERDVPVDDFVERLAREVDTRAVW